MKKINLIWLTAIMGLTVSCSKPELKNDDLNLNLKSAANAALSSPVGDVVGKLVVGYQGWFGAPGDGSPLNSWRHWSGSIPSPGHQSFELYPDMREYSTTFATGYANLGNGQPATLFSSYTDNTVNKHFQWMQQYGIDCAALQRFGSELYGGDPVSKAQRDGMAIKVKNAAQTYGRKFYIMYDISGWTNFQTDIKTDWTNTIIGNLNLLSSSAYARQNDKPVVCIWGPGTNGRPGNVASYTDVINWFKAQGCYVIVGTDKNWRSNVNFPALVLANMISPWTVGALKYDVEVDDYATVMAADLAECNTRGIDFQPVVYPGFAWSNWNGGPPNDFPRRHGDLMWRQFYQVKNKGITNVYVAMFDEYDEGTAIAKAAENSSMIPTNQYFLTLDADGVALTSDFYLRLTGDGGKMIKGLIPLVAAHPTPHLTGGYLDQCNATTGWGGSNPLTINTTDKKEGTGSLQSVGSGTDEFKKTFTAFNPGVTVLGGKIDFWYYVSDVTKFSAGDQIEIGSGGAPDVNEYNWSIGTLVNGWNHIIKPFSSASITGGTPNLNAVNWFRIYHPKTASITTRIDAIQILP